MGIEHDARSILWADPLRRVLHEQGFDRFARDEVEILVSRLIAAVLRKLAASRSGAEKDYLESLALWFLGGNTEPRLNLSAHGGEIAPAKPNGQAYRRAG